MKKILLVALLLISTKIFALDISYTPMKSNSNPNDFCYHTFLLYGDIKKGDANKVINEIGNLRKRYGNTKCPQGMKPMIEIDSNGGDVQEAMRIGKFLRQGNFNTYVSISHIIKKNNDFDLDVMNKGQCVSSCVFIFAGGVEKNFNAEFNKIGIHRPYFSSLDSNLSVNEIKIAREKMLKEIKDYLSEMEINTSLADDMLGTPPERIKYLTESELEKYRLIGKDPNYDEYETAKNAKVWNLSSAEYRKRDALGNQKCQYLSDQKKYGESVDCWQAVVLGISKDEYDKRRILSRQNCSQLKDEQKNNCVRNTFLFGKN